MSEHSNMSPATVEELDSAAMRTTVINAMTQQLMGNPTLPTQFQFLAILGMQYEKLDDEVTAGSGGEQSTHMRTTYLSMFKSLLQRLEQCTLDDDDDLDMYRRFHRVIRDQLPERFNGRAGSIDVARYFEVEGPFEPERQTVNRALIKVVKFAAVVALYGEED